MQAGPKEYQRAYILVSYGVLYAIITHILFSNF